MHTIEMNTPMGVMYLSEEDGRIVRISKEASAITESNEMLENCKHQLQEYFEGKRIEFDFPVCLKGTEFQKSIWTAMRKIKYGETVSYQQLAKLAGFPNAVRATGTACGKNPIGIVIPCHRILRSNGEIGGYAWGVEMKQFLLKLEMEEK